MRLSMRLNFVLLTTIALLCGCGGSSGSALLPAPTLAVYVPPVPAGEGFVYDGGSTGSAGVNIQMGDSVSNVPVVGLLCFDITGLGDVQDAILTIHRSTIIGNPWSMGPLLVDHIENGGVVDQTVFAGGTLSAAVHQLDDQDNWVLDVTDLVAADRAAGRTTSAFRFRFASQTNGDGQLDLLRIAASGTGFLAWQPGLFIQHVAP